MPTRRTYAKPSHAEIDVRRPTGEIETVRLPDSMPEISARQFETIKRNTKAAGRGDALAYRNVQIQVAESDDQLRERLAGEAADRMLDREALHRRICSGSCNS